MKIQMKNTYMIRKMTMVTIHTSLSSKLCTKVGIVYKTYSFFQNGDMITTEQVSNIQQAVLAGTYRLSPRKIVFMEEHERPLYGKYFLSLIKVSENNSYMGIYMEPYDRLVLMALGEVMVEEFGDSSYLNSTISCQTSDDFINKVLGWGKVENLLLCNLSNAPSHLCRTPLKIIVSSLVSDQVIRDLLLSFIDLPILLHDGTDVSDQKGIPSVCVLTDFLENLYYIDIDHRIENSNPSLYGARYNAELIIPVYPDQIKKENNAIKNFQNLLVGWNTIVNVMVIVPGGSPVEFNCGMIKVTEYNEINIIPREGDQ